MLHEAACRLSERYWLERQRLETCTAYGVMMPVTRAWSVKMFVIIPKPPFKTRQLTNLHYFAIYFQ